MSRRISAGDIIRAKYDVPCWTSKSRYENMCASDICLVVESEIVGNNRVLLHPQFGLVDIFLFDLKYFERISADRGE